MSKVSDVASGVRRKVAFLTATRADFGKLKPLMQRLNEDSHFEVHLFVTGMHMLSNYGSTWTEVRKAGFGNLYTFINQNSSDSMDHILAKTVSGLADYVVEIEPEMLVVHGDRVEALAGATVGALNNILTSHVEGGEVSGTVDELIRHAVSKLSHVHFVANDLAKDRLLQLGEVDHTVHVIGSPDIDVMNSDSLPTVEEARQRYEFPFADYGILMFHSVTTECKDLRRQIRVVVDDVIASGCNYLVVYPNNDPGTEIILDEYSKLRGHERFRLYPSLRFEHFLTLLKHAQFIIGNSSAGVREAPHFGVPAINLGSRQNNRVKSDAVLEVKNIESGRVAQAIAAVADMPRNPRELFGDGNSAERFHDIVTEEKFWAAKTQKFFVDRRMAPRSSGGQERRCS